jgi:hypothetical protein
MDHTPLTRAIQTCVNVGDYVTFNPLPRNIIGLGEIVGAERNRLKVKLFKAMDSEAVQRYMIKPIAATQYTIATQDGMLEVYLTSEEIYIERAVVQDVAFILSVEEVESGMFHLAGAANTFFIRFFLERGVMQPYNRSIYFSRYLIEPLSIQLFMTLNTLSQHLRRSMYHLAESEVSSKSFRLPLFSMEAFMYLACKVQPQTAGKSIIRKQSITQYCNTLKMVYLTKENILTYIRIASLPGLVALRSILGSGIGVGLTKSHPTKKNPVLHCTIGSILTSIECGPLIPEQIIEKPERRSFFDGIDFVYSEQNRNLNCNVRFTKITVTSAADATARIASANIVSAESSVYRGVWFQYNDDLLEVTSINGNVATCSYVEETNLDTVNLSVDLVENLVKMFGK